METRLWASGFRGFWGVGVQTRLQGLGRGVEGLRFRSETRLIGFELGI